MQTPTAFKTLKRLSAQLMRNRESAKLEMPLIAAAEYGRISVAHRSSNLWHFKLWNRGDVKGMNRDIDDPYRQSGAKCLSHYKKMHPAAVAALDKRFLPASEVYCSPTFFSHNVADAGSLNEFDAGRVSVHLFQEPLLHEDGQGFALTPNFKFICKHLLKLYHSAWYRATNSKEHMSSQSR